jgi:hypothetical protein
VTSTTKTLRLNGKRGCIGQAREFHAKADDDSIAYPHYTALGDLHCDSLRVFIQAGQLAQLTEQSVGERRGISEETANSHDARA